MRQYEQQQPDNFNVGLLTVLGLIFIVLKLVGTIDWSWWWVLAPFWGQFAIAGLVLTIALIVAAIGTAIQAVNRKKI